MNYPTVTLRSALSGALHRFPLSTGRGRIANSRVMRALDPKDPSSITLARLSNGNRLWVQSRDFVGRSVIYFGDLDSKISEILRRLLRPGDTFIDIGAQFGLYSIQAAALVGETGHVHSFEPQPRSADLLTSSIEVNGFRNVSVHRFGLGSSPGVASMAIPNGNVGAGSLVHQFESAKTVDIPIQNASEALRASCAGGARLVKIDVEGFEGEVIKGAVDWIDESKPDALIIETAQRQPLSTYSFYHDLSRLGYQFLQIGRSPFRLSLLEVEPDQPLQGFDVVAFRNQSIIQQLRQGT